MGSRHPSGKWVVLVPPPRCGWTRTIKVSDKVLMLAPEQVAAQLSATALVRSPAHNYRNRMVYDLRTGGAAGCELSLPTVWEARCVVYRWAAEASSMPLGFCAFLRVKSELDVRAHNKI